MLSRRKNAPKQKNLLTNEKKILTSLEYNFRLQTPNMMTLLLQESLKLLEVLSWLFSNPTQWTPGSGTQKMWAQKIQIRAKRAADACTEHQKMGRFDSKISVFSWSLNIQNNDTYSITIKYYQTVDSFNRISIAIFHIWNNIFEGQKLRKRHVFDPKIT